MTLAPRRPHKKKTPMKWCPKCEKKKVAIFFKNIQIDRKYMCSNCFTRFTKKELEEEQ